MKMLKYALMLAAWWIACAVGAWLFTPQPDLILMLFRASLAFVVGMIIFAAVTTIMRRTHT